MAIQPLQLPVWKDLPQLNFAPLDAAGDAFAAYRQRGALADALPGMLGMQPDATQGAPLNALGQGQPAQPASPDAKTMFDGLVQRGLSPTAAAGVVGNLQRESSLNPNGIGDGGTAFGLAQWRGPRLTGLQQFASTQGKDFRDPNVQLDYLMSELKGPEARAFSGLQAAQTPGDAATAFMAQFERPSAQAAAQSGPLRVSAANQVFQGAQGGNSQFQASSQPAPQQPQAAPGAPPQPTIPPEAMARLQAMIRAGGPAQQFAMAMLQKYVVPQTPVVVNEGGIAFNPVTGAVIARGQPKSYPVAAGGALVSPGQAGTPGGSGGGAIYQNDTGKLDAPTLDGMARRYLETGDNQIITDAGNGTMGAINRAALMNRVEQLRARSGKSGTDIVGAKGDAGNQVESIKAFGAGTQGNTVRSLNVAVDHLALLRDLARQMTDATGNSNFRPTNALVNAFRTEFGSDLPTNVEAAKHIVAAEITKAVTGSQGALGDRDALTAPLQTANSWQQLSGVIDKAYTPLMAGQLNGLRQQYVVNTKKDGASFDAMLSDRTKAALNAGSAPQSGTQAQQQAAPTLPTPKVQSYSDVTQSLTNGKAAIAKGVPRDAVIQRLIEGGVPKEMANKL